MKKILSLLVILAMAFAPSASAFLCGVSPLNDSPECVEQVMVKSAENTIVSRGMVLVYDIDSSTPRQGSYQVRVGSATADSVFVAGVAKHQIASGQVGLVVVRGKTPVRTKANETTAVSSGTQLWVSTSGDVGNVANTNTKSIGFALHTAGATDTTNESFITIV